MKAGHLIGAAAAVVAAVALILLPQHHRAGPDFLYPSIPGATNPAVTQANIGSTICATNWTATIRPPASYTNALKKKQLTSVGGTAPDPATMAQFEEDHFISLELGGNPTDPNNLWPEAYNGTVNGKIVGARQKDQAENALKAAVCAGQITLKDAQAAIVDDWYAVYLAKVTPATSSIDPNDN